jgi:hypothetical protein
MFKIKIHVLSHKFLTVQDKKLQEQKLFVYPHLNILLDHLLDYERFHGVTHTYCEEGHFV